MTVEVEAFDYICGSLIAYVIKSRKAGAVDIIDAMIRDQELLLPPHIDEVFVIRVIHESIIVEYLNIRFE